MTRTVRSPSWRAVAAAAASVVAPGQAGLEEGSLQRRGRNPRLAHALAAASDRQMVVERRMEEAMRAREEEREREEGEEKEREAEEEAKHEKQMEEREERVMAVAQSLRRTELEEVAEKKEGKGFKEDARTNNGDADESVAAATTTTSSTGGDGSSGGDEFLPMADLAKRAMLLRVRIGLSRVQGPGFGV